MKFFTFLFTIIISSAYAQTNYFPDGIYLSIEQIKTKTPRLDTTIHIIKRSSGDIVMSGGNDYKLQSDSLAKGFLRDDVLAFAKNDSLFINCSKFKLQYWYALCLTKGNFLVFRAAMSSDDAFATGFVGGALAAGLTAKVRYLNVLSLRTGNVKEATPEYVSKRLAENQDLLAQYNAEPDKKSESVLIKYLDLLNQFILPDSKPPVDPSQAKKKRH